MRPVIGSLLVAVLLSGLPADSPAARMDRRTYALSLLQEGKRRLAIGSIDQRRAALALFEDAALVAPKDPAVLVVLGDAYADARYLHRARTVFERALRLAPEDPDVHFGFARIHRREWLEFAWAVDLSDAISEAREATRLRPEFVRAWAALSALEVEQGDLPRAAESAERALAADPQQAEADLVAAEMAYRTGQIPRADSLFGIALGRLDPRQAARFADITPLISMHDAEIFQKMDAARQAAWVRRFWNENDPDPVTPQNEARLEYWSRQSHALLLLGDPWGPIWRERTAVYVRYGKHVQIDDPMRSQHYEMPRLDLGEVAATPSPAQLERINRVTAGGGQSAFAPLPPGTVPLPLAARVMRFQGDSGTRVLAQIESPGAPGEPLASECVVFDADDRLVARAVQALSPSACDPVGKRTGDFVFTLPPGSYRLAFAVHDTADRRGVRRVLCEIGPLPKRLSMSELAPNCGPPSLAAGEGGVRLFPNPRAWVDGTEPLVAYFEIYHLQTTASRASRFEYHYEVRELGAPGVPWYRQLWEGRAAAEGLAFRTIQDGVGPLRRQFIQVPTKTLPAGRYEIQITVRDLLSGQEVMEAMPFSRVWSQSELWGEPASH